MDTDRISTPHAFEVPQELRALDRRREADGDPVRPQGAAVWIFELPSWWNGVTSWAVAAGVVAMLLTAMTVGLRSRTASASAAAAPDGGVVRISASEAKCATLDRAVRARLDVDVAIDGRVTRAAAGQNLGVIQSCVEAHARSWEFLPQAAPVTLALDVVIDPI